MEKNAIKLEFNKIIEKVARNAVSKSVKEQILTLQFLQNNKEIEKEIFKNTEANNSRLLHLFEEKKPATAQ